MAPIALIRSEGKEFADGPTLSPERFVRLPPLARASKTPATRIVEADFSLGDCLYFYAGHACPDFGDVVLVYDGEMADADSGGATPFDTGGLHAGHVHYSNPRGPATAAGYCKAHTCTLSTWRVRADAYIASHFSSASAYVSGHTPITDDPTGRLLHRDNSRRAWTWEIRVHRDHDLEQDLRAIWMSADYYEAVRQLTLENPVRSVGCRSLLADGTIRGVAAAASPHLAAEQEVAGWV
jgi:hypothetical protein